ncbi:PIN domain-containing protein [Streptomyces murinus]|uniref:PIN domain-containing protein n=1 Tax=Streptomyces murinus TaxID=33900 RepID=UPI003F482A49
MRPWRSHRGVGSDLLIILDTCILRECGLGSSSTDLLRAIRAAGAQSASVPWMVLEELAAQQAVKYVQKHEAAERAVKALTEVTPWEYQARLAPAVPDNVREHWRTEWRSVVDVIPTSEAALREAAFREANGLAPCKIQEGGRSTKTGFRDAAIWLSAIEYAREHPHEEVFFVSSNTRDFGNGSGDYRAPMDQDVWNTGNLTHLTSLDDVISRFAPSTDIEDGRAQTILKSEAVLTEAGRVAHSTLRTFRCTIASGALGRQTELGQVTVWMEQPAAVLDSIKDVDAYKIGDHEWCTASVRWILAGRALLQGGTHLVTAGCSWETRVLFSLSAGTDARLTILRSSAPAHISTRVFDGLPILIDPPSSIPQTVEKATAFIETAFAEESEDEKGNNKGRTILCTECDTLNDPRSRACMVCSSPL